MSTQLSVVQIRRRPLLAVLVGTFAVALSTFGATLVGHVATASAATVITPDEFSGTSLDQSTWSVVSTPTAPRSWRSEAAR